MEQVTQRREHPDIAPINTPPINDFDGLADRQNLIIARLAGKISLLGVRLDQAYKDLARLKRKREEQESAIAELFAAVKNILPFVDEAIYTLSQHETEISGLDSALAELKRIQG